MAITDIQISEELETNAPSIKYSGSEGPKSPQEEMMMVDAMLQEEYQKYVFDLLEIRPEATPMTLEEFKQMVIAEGQMSKGPILPSPEDPVNPFGPKPIGPPLPDRQMAAYGGIMGMDGRRQYGIGSSFKKFVRKIIPNEVAKVAEVAAPFVAPFNPLAAGLMSGIGGFDRTGSIGSSLKSGLMNYALGQGSRALVGAPMQQGFNLKINPGASRLGQYFSNPLTAAAAKAPADIGAVTSDAGFTNTANENVLKSLEGTSDYFPGTVSGKMADSSISNKFLSSQKDKFSLLDIPRKIKNSLEAAGLGNNLVTGLLVGGLGAGALMGNMTEEEQVEMNRGEGMDVEAIRQEVLTAMKDPSGEALKAIRIKYPFLGRQDTKDIDAIGKAMGGRIGMAEGGIMDLGGMEKDYRAEGGFVPIGKAEKADDVPARLSVNEFVFTADAVRNAGGGDIDKGAEVMENMMNYLEQGGQVSEESQGMAGAQQMFETSERLNEVI
jgi:hypothetical protein